MQVFIKNQFNAFKVKENWIKTVSFVLPECSLNILKGILKKEGMRVIGQWKDFITENYLCTGIELSVIIWITPLSNGDLQITIHRLRSDYLERIVSEHHL